MIAALIVPVVAVAAAGGVELGFLLTDKGKLQAAADAAALATAHELALAVNDGVTERAKALALSQVESLRGRSTVTADATIVENGTGIRVGLTANRDSFFGNLLPPGGFTTRAEATAVGMSKTPLCILAHGKGFGDAINTKDSSTLTAPGCLVHSNDQIKVEGASTINAGLIQSVTSASGSMTPKAGVGAEPIEDPFSLHDLTGQGVCVKLLDVAGQKALHRLPKGRHCGSIEIKDGKTLVMEKGEHFFEGAELKMSGTSKLIGNDVVMVFDKASKFTFQDTSTVNLTGRQTGRFAGFLIVTARDNTNDFLMISDNVRELLGVIYIPAAKLIVDGKDAIAEQSAWTVIVAERLELKGSPKLVINRDYGVGGVPVPAGVGNTATDVRLSN